MRLSRFLAAVAFAVLCAGESASAHPLGNFSVNHLVRIGATPHGVTVRYVLDLAEIPTFALERSLDPHARPPQPVLARWAGDHVAEIAPRLVLTIDGAPVRLVPVGPALVHLRAGAGGLPTLRFDARFAARAAPGPHALAFRDETEPGRIGWKDVVAGAVREPTEALTRYPDALVGSPRARSALAARLDGRGSIVDAGMPSGGSDAARGTAAAAAPAAVAAVPLARSNALSDILARGPSSAAAVLAALLLALALGALHALEPGHGKTLLAVSLVGARATPRQAFLLAGALTVAHTAGVLALGALVLAAAAWIVPERIYPWVTLGSGVVVTLLGARAVSYEVRRRLPHVHVHAHAHAHAHPHEHEHVHGAHEHHDGLDELAHARAHAIPGGAPLTFRSAVLAAASGNVAPCPAAFVVLLTAMQLRQVGYGLALIVAFGVGLAATLTILGLAVVRGTTWLIARPRFARTAQWAPLVTACAIAAIGAVLVGQGIAAGSGADAVLVAALVLLAIFGYVFAWHAPRPSARARA